jgi:hypothetical protein
MYELIPYLNKTKRKVRGEPGVASITTVNGESYAALLLNIDDPPPPYITNDLKNVNAMVAWAQIRRKQWVSFGIKRVPIMDYHALTLALQ